MVVTVHGREAMATIIRMDRTIATHQEARGGMRQVGTISTIRPVSLPWSLPRSFSAFLSYALVTDTYVFHVRHARL